MTSYSRNETNELCGHVLRAAQWIKVQGQAGPDVSAVIIERRLGRNHCQDATERFHFFHMEFARLLPIWRDVSTDYARYGSRGVVNRRASGPDHKSYYNDAFGIGCGGCNTTLKQLITAE